MEQQLNRLYLAKLKKIAKELKIKGRSRMNKPDLIKEFTKFSDEEIIKLIKKDDINNINNNYICIHNKIKYCCKECDGSQLCIHNKN